MALPKLSIPTYRVEVPSLKKRVLMKSLTAKEYKLLLVAKESSNEEQIIVTLRQLLSNCLLEKLDLNKLFMFDIEYIFLQMIMSSTATSTQQLSYKCKNMVFDEAEEKDVVCNTSNKITINLKNAKVDLPKSTEKSIVAKTESGEDISLKFTYPTFSVAETTVDSINGNSTDSVAACMTSVFTNDETLKLGRDYTIEEASSMIDDMPEDSMKEIGEFFKTIPKLKLEHKFKCSKCGFDHTIKLEGITDFFQ